MIWMLISALLAAVSQILLKRSANMPERTGLRAYLNPEVLAGYILLAVSLLCNVIAYQSMPYKWGPVVASLSYILVPLFSHFVFHETLNALFFAGMALILAGIAVFGL